MYIDLVPQKSVRLTELDGSELIKAASQISEYILLIEGDIRKGAFTREDVAGLVRGHVQSNMKIRHKFMAAGAAILLDADRRGGRMTRAVESLFTPDIVTFLRGWYPMRGQSVPRPGDEIELVETPRLKLEL